MIRRNNLRSRRGLRALHPRESGYALLMAFFMIIIVIISSQVVMENLLTRGRREREAEMIWRGEQVQRAIRLYYRKTGHYPQTLEDLEKGLPQLYFLRHAAYKDPMNRADGSWRMIYVNAAGQIIGRTLYATLQQMAIMDANGGKLPAVQQGAQVGTPISNMASGSSGANVQSPQGTQPGDNSSSQAPGTATGNAPAGAQNPPAGLAPASGTSPNPLTALKPTGPVDGPVLGAFLTGVVSRSARPSIKFYKGGKKYSEWEFIWNPLEDQVQAIQQGLTPQGAQPGQPGQPIGPGGIGSFPPPPDGGAIIPPTSPPTPPNP
jgi:hypothetical protein